MPSGLTQKPDLFATRDENPYRLGHAAASTPESELVQRVLASPAFARSALLSKFLLYISDRTLAGREEEITEYQIGVALGRPDTYNPGDDNIVRHYARILRKRLEEYFTGEGRGEPVRIVIPVGHYVPVFEPNLPLTGVSPVPAEHQVVSTAPRNPEVAPDKKVSPRRNLQMLWIPAAILLVAGIGVFAWWKTRPQPTSVNDIFWREIFDHNHPTYFVPGDSGLAMMQEITGKEVHLSDYIAGDLDEKFHDFNLAAARGGVAYSFDRISHYTSKADLSIAVGVDGMAYRYSGQLRVRYASDMHTEDFKGSNVFLIGGPRANPWDELFEPESNFVMYFPMHSDGIHFDERTFLNKHPQADEPSAYTNRDGDPFQRAYALLAFLPEADNAGHVLLLEGAGMAGTQAAGDFLLNQRAMEPVLKRAQLPDGSIGPFELLLEARTVGDNAPEAHIVAERFGMTKNSE